MKHLILLVVISLYFVGCASMRKAPVDKVDPAVQEFVKGCTVAAFMSTQGQVPLPQIIVKCEELEREYRKAEKLELKRANAPGVYQENLEGYETQAI